MRWPVPCRAEIIHFNRKLVGIDESAGGVRLAFADGSHAVADAVVGADGVHSLVRELVIGPDEPIHKGRIAYRAVFRSERLKGRDLGPSRTKWWGVDRHSRHLLRDRDAKRGLFRHQRAGTGGLADPRVLVPRRATWRKCGPPTKDSIRDVAAVLDACPDCPQVGDPGARAAAAVERQPRGAAGGCVPPDDAVHGPGAPPPPSRMPRCWRAVSRLSRATISRARSEVTRRHEKPRTSKIQAISSANTWMQGGDQDTSWLYGYDAWNVPLAEAEANRESALVS